MHVRNHLSEEKNKIPPLKNAQFLLRGWTQTKILFRKMEKIFSLKHDRDANSPSNAGAAGIEPVVLHVSGLWWSALLVRQQGQTEEWEQDLCHRTHLSAFKHKLIGSSVIVRLLKRLLWLDVASVNLNVLVSEKPPPLFLSSVFWTKKIWDIFRQVLFLGRKNLKDFPPFPCCTGLHYWQLYKYSVWPIHVRVQCSIKLGIDLLHPFKNLIWIFFVLI